MSNVDAYRPVKVALAGLGKMGLSHQAITNMHPDLNLVSVCDSATYVLDVMKKYTGLNGYVDYTLMLETEKPDAVIIATPSFLHEKMVREALLRNIHVFCEKPFCLDVNEGAKLVLEAERRHLVNQVGYHNRFVGTFVAAKDLISRGVIGKVHHASAECYGPVVLRPKAATWRASRQAGGGCLYDYACHGLDLINFMIGQPNSVRGSMLRTVFSSEIEDEVYANLYYADGKTARISANWSDDSFRKMSTTISVWGTKGRLIVGRQDLSLYLRRAKDMPAGLSAGWTTRYAPSLTQPVQYYLRGEEYSAQIEHFAACIRQRELKNRSDFRSAISTDIVVDWIRKDAADTGEHAPHPYARDAERTFLRRFKSRLSQLGLGRRAPAR